MKILSPRFLYRRLRSLWQRDAVERSMAEEIQSHLDQLTDRKVKEGMSLAEARRETLREFGGLEQIKERSRDEQRRGIIWLDNIERDLRYAGRQLRKSPVFTMVAVLSLGLGVGANVAIFSLFNAAVLRPLPVKHPEQLVLLNWSARNWPAPFSQTGDDSSFSFSYPAFERMRRSAGPSVELFAFVPVGIGSDNLTIVAGGQLELANGVMVSGAYFSSLSADLALGRGIVERDEGKGQARVAVLSYAFWVNQFNRDPAILGREVTINNLPFNIVGVARPGFYGILPVGQSDRPDIWLPILEETNLRPWGEKPNGSDSISTANNWLCLNIGARISPAIGRAETIAQLGTIFRNFVSENWKSASPEDLPTLNFLEAGTALAGLRGQTVRPLTILMCAVGLMLLIGCANVATLLLARASSREREMNIRASLGASRGRLVRQLMTESLVLAALGGIAGLMIAYWACQGLPMVILPHPARAAIDVTIDKDALFFTFAVSLLTGVIFGIIPACRLTHTDLTAATKQRAASENRRSQRIGKTLVTGQLAVSLVLMICAGLFVRTLRYMEKRDLGFDGSHLLLFELDPTRAGYQGDRLSALYERIRQRIAALPGVSNVTLNEHLPFTWTNNSNFRIEGSSLHVSDSNARWSRVGPNFCATMNASIVLGRDLRDSDGPSSNRVGVINETFAQRFFGGENPLGHRFIGIDEKTSFEIVGVVRDLFLTDLHDSPTPEVYISYLQTSSQLLNVMSYEVLTEGDPMTSAREVAKAVISEAPNLPLMNLIRQSEQTSNAMFIELMFSRLATFFGAVTLALSCIGLYGTIAYQVARRVPEIGIRLSLGATPRAVLQMILSQSLVLVATGIALGLTLSFVATGTLRTMIFGVSVNDTATFGYSSAIMLIVAILACWIPARRASRVDPTRSLRMG